MSLPGSDDTQNNAPFADIKNPPVTGMVDRFIRRFGVVSHALAILVLYAVASIAIGLALAPALWFLSISWDWVADFNACQKWPLLGFSLGLAFFIAGFTLLLVVPIFNSTTAVTSFFMPFEKGEA